MKFRHLAIRNMRGNWHQYSAFFLSSVFSVMIFFIYAAFIFHPDVVNGHIEAAAKVRQGMIACEYIIIIFSFFFVLYSISAFLKSRKKEFGLLSLFGMTNGQIKRMVLYENTVISLLAIGTGIALGILFSKLFFMALAELLDVESPIRFLIAPKALLVTAGGFFIVFQVITWFSLLVMGRSQIVELLSAASKPKSIPLFSKWLVSLSILCLCGGYYLAYTMNANNAVMYVLPILFLVIVGTYFLFTQASVAILRKLQRGRSFYYKRTNMITVSQLVFRMKDNARILFMVSILSAVILTASGTFYVYYQGGKAQLVEHFPQTIGFVEKGLNTHQVVDPQQLKDILKQDGVEIEYEVKLVGAPAPVTLQQVRYGDKNATALVVSETDFNRQAERLPKMSPVSIAEGHALFVYPYREMKIDFFTKGGTMETQVNGKKLSLTMDGQTNGAIVLPYSDATMLLVVNDAQYKEIMRSVPDERKTVVYGYELKNWTSTGATVDKIDKLVPEKMQYVQYRSRVQTYTEAMQLASLTMFIGLFVSFLFFIASGSMIYFKLFTEVQDDQAQFKALTRIGMTVEEIRRIVTAQIAVIFFVPCVAGIIHTMFAMKSLGNMLNTEAWLYALVVIVIFIVMQFLYFLAARRTYMKKMLMESVV